MRNLAVKVPEDQWPEFKARVQAAYQAPSRAPSRSGARDLAERVVKDYADDLPSAVTCFEDDLEACIAHLRLPIGHRRAIRTTNLLERLFAEERRRLKIIPTAFGEKPVLKLMFGAMIRAAERWRAIKSTTFEQRQSDALRKELNQGYEAENGLEGSRSAADPSNPNLQQFSDLTVELGARRVMPLCLRLPAERWRAEARFDSSAGCGARLPAIGHAGFFPELRPATARGSTMRSKSDGIDRFASCGRSMRSLRSDRSSGSLLANCDNLLALFAKSIEISKENKDFS